MVWKLTLVLLIGLAVSQSVSINGPQTQNPTSLSNDGTSVAAVVSPVPLPQIILNPVPDASGNNVQTVSSNPLLTTGAINVPSDVMVINTPNQPNVQVIPSPIVDSGVIVFQPGSAIKTVANDQIVFPAIATDKKLVQVNDNSKTLNGVVGVQSNPVAVVNQADNDLVNSTADKPSVDKKNPIEKEDYSQGSSSQLIFASSQSLTSQNQQSSKIEATTVNNQTSTVKDASAANPVKEDIIIQTKLSENTGKPIIQPQQKSTSSKTQLKPSITSVPTNSVVKQQPIAKTEEHKLDVSHSVDQKSSNAHAETTHVQDNAKNTDSSQHQQQKKSQKAAQPVSHTHSKLTKKSSPTEHPHSENSSQDSSNNNHDSIKKSVKSEDKSANNKKSVGKEEKKTPKDNIKTSHASTMQKHKEDRSSIIKQNKLHKESSLYKQQHMNKHGHLRDQVDKHQSNSEDSREECSSQAEHQNYPHEDQSHSQYQHHLPHHYYDFD